MKVADVPAILAQYGISLEADAETLTAGLEERGWQVTVEEVRVGAAQRYTAQAAHYREGGTLHETARATGTTPPAALGFVLAKVLEKERAR